MLSTRTLVVVRGFFSNKYRLEEIKSQSLSAFR